MLPIILSPFVNLLKVAHFPRMKIKSHLRGAPRKKKKTKLPKHPSTNKKLSREWHNDITAARFNITSSIWQELITLCSPPGQQGQQVADMRHLAGHERPLGDCHLTLKLSKKLVRMPARTHEGRAHQYHLFLFSSFLPSVPPPPCPIDCRLCEERHTTRNTSLHPNLSFFLSFFPHFFLSSFLSFFLPIEVSPS